MDDIIVLDYCDSSVWIYKLPWLNMDDTAIADWLDSMGFNIDLIEWMVNSNITINDER